jgi:hypothetical protein
MLQRHLPLRGENDVGSDHSLKAAELRSADSRGRLSPHTNLGNQPSSCAELRNREFIGAFEADLIRADSFHHADHVRLAFAYLSEYPALEALEKFSTALRRYATARGKPRLYHETITHAYFFLIRERMARFPTLDWDEFSRRNSDLLTWKDGILTRYYAEATLKSDLARMVFVFPDKVI